MGGSGEQASGREVHKRGVLQKMGQLNPSFRARVFTLHGTNLMYRNDDSELDSECLGIIPIEKSVVQIVHPRSPQSSSAPPPKRYVFRLQVTGRTARGSNPVYILGAATPGERDE